VNGKLLNNQLNYIRDEIGGSTAHSSNYSNDIDNQSANNYSYDSIGNLVKDNAEGITDIKWSVYGKILEIQKTASGSNPTTDLQYGYDASGNRISKKVTDNSGNITYTWYVRDAQGNVMSTYTSTGTGGTLTSYPVTLSEQHLYGSSRLGILSRSLDVKSTYTPGTIVTFQRGLKNYELSNHLGNVLVTISDKKTGVSTNGTTIDNFTADVRSATDYFPFGMQMPNRTYTASSNYRYGFNGKENDNEVKGIGNEIDYGMRIYDTRVGRFLSVDPLMKEFPWYTPYQFAGNKPIPASDLDGLEEWMKTQENLLRQNAIMKLDKLKIRSQQRQAFVGPTPERSQYEERNLREYRIQRYQEMGYNDDGSEPGWVKLAKNKTWKSFAENIALPLFEGYSYIDGAAELRALYKGAQVSAVFLGRREFEAMATTGTVNAKLIRFSQDDISLTFRDKSEVQALVDQLKSGQKVEIPPIRLVEKDNMIFTLDNRRLKAYQEAGVDIPYVKLDKVPTEELDKFSTKNNGVSIEFKKPKKKN
ncbi:MAG TPA: RHS repeat-associated core domain-containing protein, partial [Puia sp.]|nr:RHS repeat-associated core domain-containing protein [Puia sp.]